MEAGVQVGKKKSKGHRCYLCGHRFPTIHMVRKHVNVHKEKDLQCSVCGKFFSSKWGLSKHMGMHTGLRPYQCEHCGRTFRQKVTLTNHVAKIHDGDNDGRICSACKTCGKNLKAGSREEYCWLCWYQAYSNSATTTVSECVDVSETVTIDCNSTENSNGETCAESNSNCQECGKVLLRNETTCCSLCRSAANRPALEHEIAVAMISSTNSSNITEKKNSDFVFPYVNIMPEVEENPRNPCCSQCTVAFPNLVALREHNRKVHKPHWQFSCQICSATFATSGAQKHHMIIHEENRPFSCLVCSRAFKNQLGLKNHLITHRTDRPFKCKICGLSYKTLLTLKAHTVVHQKERPYICRECGFTFKTVFLLKRHTIVHSGEMPYKCDICDKRFRYHGNLGRHNLLHTRQGSFACSTCGKVFPQYANLKQHEQIHNKNVKSDKTLMCPFCNKAYKSVLHLRKHITTHRMQTS